MFPTIRVSFRGHFDSSSRYVVLMDVIPVDAKRYRYAYHRSAWLAAGKADPAAPGRFYVHPDSPFTVARDGPDLLGKLQTVSFEKLKLTNNTLDTGGRVSFVTVAIEGHISCCALFSVYRFCVVRNRIAYVLRT